MQPRRKRNKVDKQATNGPFDQLTDDLMRLIFSHFSQQDREIARTNKTFHKFFHDPILWHTRFEQRFPKQAEALQQSSNQINWEKELNNLEKQRYQGLTDRVENRFRLIRDNNIDELMQSSPFNYEAKSMLVFESLLLGGGLAALNVSMKSLKAVADLNHYLHDQQGFIIRLPASFYRFGVLPVCAIFAGGLGVGAIGFSLYILHEYINDLLHHTTFQFNDLIKLDNANNSLLTIAAEQGNQTLLDCFYLSALKFFHDSNHPNNINHLKKDENGCTILHWAIACNRSEDDIQQLLDQGANVNEDSVLLGNPLPQAITYRKDKIALLLYKNGANLEWGHLIKAIEYGLDAIAIKVIDETLDTLNLEAINKLTYAAIKSNRLSVMALLLQNGANPRASSDIDDSMIEYAATAGNVEALDLLLAHDAANNTNDLPIANQNYIVFDTALNGNFVALRSLLLHGYSPSTQISLTNTRLRELVTDDPQATQQRLEKFLKAHLAQNLEQYGCTAKLRVMEGLPISYNVSPLEIAQIMGHTESATVLREFIAREAASDNLATLLVKASPAR